MRNVIFKDIVVAGMMLIVSPIPALCLESDWEPLGPPGGYASEIVYHPTLSGLVYLDAGGLWYSLDEGRMWYLVPDMPRVRGQILIDPFRPSVLLIGRTENYVTSLKRSTNYGQTWETVLENVAIDGSAFDPAQPGVVYVGTIGHADKSREDFEAKFYRSTDHGVSWTLMNPGGTGEGYSYVWWFTLITPSPKDGSILAHTGWSNGIGGVWTRVMRSTNGGADWSYDDTGLPVITTSDMQFVIPRAAVACTGDGFYAQLVGGNRWHAVPNEMSGRNTLGLSPGPDPNVWYLVEELTGPDVIHRSTDWGLNWTELPMMGGLCDISTVAVDPLAEPGAETILAGVPQAGVFATTDFGQTWEHRAQGLPPISTLSLGFGPAGSGLLYAGTSGTYYAGLYRSTDEGLSWELANEGIPRGEVLSLCANPADEQIIFAARGEVFRSTDQGDNWTQVSSGFTATWCVVIDPQNPDIVFAGTKEHGLFKSTDGGDSWFFSGEGMAGVSVRDIVMDPLEPLHMFAANAGGGIYESEDGGASWNLVLEIPSSLFVSVALSAGGERVYAGESNSANLHRSTNGGDTWEIVLADVVPNDIVVPENEPLTVAVGGNYNSGTWESFDGGDTWSQLLDSEGTFYVNELAMNPTGEGLLYAAMKSGIQMLVPTK